MDRYFVIKTPSTVTGYAGMIATREEAETIARERATKTGNDQIVLQVVGVATPNTATWKPTSW